MRVIAAGAHPDDIEIGCGGTLIKHVKAGDEVYGLVLTSGEGGTSAPSIRRAEAFESAAEVPLAELFLGNLNALDMCYVRQVFVEVIERVIAEVKPDRVYCHSENDLHQNHQVAARCSLIAAKAVPEVLSFRLPSTTIDFKPTYHVDVTEEMDAKLRCVSRFESQGDKPYMQEEWLRTVAGAHAIEAHMPLGRLAEAFYVEKMVW